VRLALDAPRGRGRDLDALDALGEAAPLIPVGEALGGLDKDGPEGGELGGLDEDGAEGGAGLDAPRLHLHRQALGESDPLDVHRPTATATGRPTSTARPSARIQPLDGAESEAEPITPQAGSWWGS
jgi:hypothetical protein